MCAAIRLTLGGEPLSTPSTPHHAAIVEGCRSSLQRGLDSYAPHLREIFAAQTFTVVYPDRSPARMAFVAPLTVPRGEPQVRLKETDIGAAGQPRPALVAHELAHAAHFTLMPVRTRAAVAARYAGWLAARVVTGSDPTHSADRRTGPLVAWLEAFGLFAERFDIYARRFGAGRSGETLHEAFLAEELDGGKRMATVLPNYCAVGSWATASDPLRSADACVEGSVYAGVFLHAGAQRGLTRAVSDYLASAPARVTSLHDYRRFIADGRAAGPSRQRA